MIVTMEGGADVSSIFWEFVADISKNCDRIRHQLVFEALQRDNVSMSISRNVLTFCDRNGSMRYTFNDVESLLDGALRIIRQAARECNRYDIDAFQIYRKHIALMEDCLCNFVHYVDMQKLSGLFGDFGV
jgi:hypothetical protein